MANPVQERNNQSYTPQIYEVVFNAGAGAYAAYLFTLVNPVGGAIFGVTRTVTSIIVSRALDHPRAARFIDNSTEGRTLKTAINFFAGLGAAWAVMAFAGFPITFSATIGLFLATIPATFIIACILGCFNSASRHRPLRHEPLEEILDPLAGLGPFGNRRVADPLARDFAAVEQIIDAEQVEGRPNAVFQGEGRRLGQL